MAIKYPIMIIIGLILFVGAYFISFKKIKMKNNNRKVANTSIVRKSKEYKEILKKYRICMYVIYAVLFVCIITSSILSARVIEVQEYDDKQHNRDIILCMDVSGSVDELNYELVDAYKEVVSSLNGERFGISIFNSSSYLLVPLTDDYDYILDALTTLGKAYGLSIDNNYEYNEENYKLLNYIYDGTSIGTDRGTSLIGDGLASCVYDFPDLDKERSRIIIFSTDNYVSGTEYINVPDAAKLTKSKKITMYAIAPKNTYGKYAEELEAAAKLTGGKYYQHGKSDTIKNVINSIESHEKSLLEGNKKTVIYDYPQVPYILMLLGFVVIIIVDKVVLS